MIPVLDTLNLVNSLGSRGYPVSWLGRVLVVPNLAAYLAERETVPVEVHARIAWAAVTYGRREADPATDGVHPGHSFAIRRQMLALGYTAPDHIALTDRLAQAEERSWLPGFDRNGDFSPRFLPGHQFERNDTLCGQLRDALGMTLARTFHTREQIMEATGCYEEQLTRMRVRLGLTYTTEEWSGDWVLVEEHPGAIKRARAIYEALEASEDVTFEALRQGIVVPQGTKAWRVPHIAKLHPAVAAFRAWQREDEDRRIAKHMSAEQHALAA